MLGATDPPTRTGDAVLRAIATAGVGAVALPVAATMGTPVYAPIWQGLVGVIIAGACMFAAARWLDGKYLRPVGIGLVAVACWLFAQSSYPVAAWLIAPTLGVGTAMAIGTGASWRLQPIGIAAAAVAAALIVGSRATIGRDAAMATGGAIVAVGAVASVVSGGAVLPGRRRGLLGFAGILLAIATAGYIGATTPSVTWFGSLTAHGPRTSDEVALTFDDGPNPPFTLQISATLDSYGVKGTFFTVGKALEARPDVSKALLDDGQLLGDHSYHHDAFSWLDPRYEELGQAQDAFRRTLGVCPALFRPPHGSHTPFMARALSDQGMTMVTWDVSAGDWATTDGELVARRVLEKVRGGSIILLHDGIDGNLGADRSVILTALPIILDGLRERSLKPVTLDKLLGVRGYLENC
jgi:peptidoglycan/xylan/chitin deacetylase (PgdA/CDA1 family)